MQREEWTVHDHAHAALRIAAAAAVSAGVSVLLGPAAVTAGVTATIGALAGGTGLAFAEAAAAALVEALEREDDEADADAIDEYLERRGIEPNIGGMWRDAAGTVRFYTTETTKE